MAYVTSYVNAFGILLMIEFPRVETIPRKYLRRIKSQIAKLDIEDRENRAAGLPVEPEHDKYILELEKRLAGIGANKRRWYS